SAQARVEIRFPWRSRMPAFAPRCSHAFRFVTETGFASIPCLFLVAATLVFYLQYLQCLFGLILRSKIRSLLANLDGSFENGPHGEYSSQFVRSYGGQAHGCDASAGSAIGIPAKLAGSDLCL